MRELCVCGPESLVEEQDVRPGDVRIEKRRRVCMPVEYE